MRFASLAPATLVAVAAGAIAWLPTMLPSFWLFLSTSAVVMAILAISVGVVTGRAGMISLCQLAFAGVGAWVAAWLSAEDVSLPFVVQMLLAGVASAAVGALVGLPALRLRGVNLAVVTLGVGVAVSTVLIVRGFPSTDVRRPGGFEDDPGFFTFAWLTFVAVAVAVWWLGRSRVGAAWLAVRHSERATASLGLNVARVKLSAFTVSAGVAGVAGALLAAQLGLITADSFAPLTSLALFALAIMVGSRHPEGAMLAGILGVFVPEFLSRAGVSRDIATMLFAVGAIQALSQGHGIADAIRAKLSARLDRRRVVTLPPSAAGERPALPRPERGAAMHAEGLAVRYGAFVALADVNLELKAGTVMGLIGPNGAGKSTLVDAVTGFIPRYEGRIEVDGRPIDRMPAHRRAAFGVRRTFQQERTIAEMRVSAYLSLAAGRRLSRQELSGLLEFVGLERRDCPLASIEVGTRRLVELAGTLASRPRVLLLDEPAAGLSATDSQRLALRIAEIPDRFGTSVLLIEHDLELVRAACAELAVLNFGRIIAHGRPSVVMRTPEVVGAYVGEVEVAA